MKSKSFSISKLATDLDTTNYEIIANDALMELIDKYINDGELTYLQLLEIAHKYKQALRR